MDKNQGICKQFQNGKCKYGQKCKYLHQKQVLCQFFLKGNCKYGKSCQYIHQKQQQYEDDDDNYDDDFDHQQNQQLSKKNFNKMQQQYVNQKEDKQKQPLSPIKGKQQQQEEQKQQQIPDQKQQIPVKQEAPNTNNINEFIPQQYKQQKFIDVSKLLDAQQIFDKNEEFFQQNGGFQSYIRNLKSPRDIEIAQITRKYQFTFQWVERNLKNCQVFQIKYSPTINYLDIKVLDFEIEEGFIWLEVIVPDSFPKEHASFLVINVSIPAPFKRAFENELLVVHLKLSNSVYKTLRYIDNYLDKVLVQTIETMKKLEKMQQQQQILQKQQEEEDKKQQQLKQQEEQEHQKQQLSSSNFDKKRLEETILEKVQIPWSQQEQTLLEQAIIQCKQIQDKDEKWSAIAQIVSTRDKDECIARFQYCKQLLLAKQQQQQQQKPNQANKTKPAKSSSSSEDDEDDDDEQEQEQEENKEGNQENQENSDIDEEEDPYQGQENESSNQDSEEDDDEEDLEEQDGKDQHRLDVDLNVTVSLRDVDFGGLQLFRASQMILKVKCISCQYETERTLCNVFQNDENILMNDILCENCNNPAQIYCKREFLHQNNVDLAIVARIGSFTWSITDVMSINYELTCSVCNKAKIIDKIVSGQRFQSQCYQCFQNWFLSYSGTSIAKREILPAFKKKKKVKQPANDDDISGFIKKKKIGVFKQGQALPNCGVCTHYKHSYRYFRFPCCGKAYPCDICHESKESGHEPLLAKAMVCGFCGVEQSVKSECSKCGKMVTRAVKKVGHWEGGKGVRDKNAMNKSDTHKYKGLNKTISQKKVKKQQMQK